MTGAVDREVREDVADVLIRYATGIDSRDWGLLRSCFTEDCEADYGDIGVWHSAEEITAWMRDVHEACGPTMHRITNIVVTTAGDGGVVVARSYIDGLVMFPDNQAGTRANGYYDDELVATDDGWKIARRRFTTVLIQFFPDATRLDDIEAIKQLKARYCRTMDTKDWAGMRRVFADDVEMDMTASGGGVIRGADDFMAFLSETLRDVVTVHHCHTPEIDLTSATTATGVWAMEDMLRWPSGMELHGYGHYHETYEKIDGHWRITRSELTRLRRDITGATTT